MNANLPIVMDNTRYECGLRYMQSIVIPKKLQLKSAINLYATNFLLRSPCVAPNCAKTVQD